MPVVLSKVETAKKVFRFLALSERAKKVVLDFLSLEDLFCLAQCSKTCKALVISQKIPGSLTWTFCSNSLATIAFNSEGHSYNLNLNLRNVILNDLFIPEDLLFNYHLAPVDSNREETPERLQSLPEDDDVPEYYRIRYRQEEAKEYSALILNDRKGVPPQKNDAWTRIKTR